MGFQEGKFEESLGFEEGSGFAEGFEEGLGFEEGQVFEEGLGFEEGQVFEEGSGFEEGQVFEEGLGFEEGRGFVVRTLQNLERRRARSAHCLNAIGPTYLLRRPTWFRVWVLEREEGLLLWCAPRRTSSARSPSTSAFRV